LLADIGATNARFALLAGGTLGAVKNLEVGAFDRFTDAVNVFLKDSGGTPVTHAVVAVAGPVHGQRCVLTNCDWTIDAEQLRASFGFAARVVNDFEAVALSLPALAVTDVADVGNGMVVPGAPTAVVGPGSGLGVACLIADSRGSNHVVLSSEGGHATLPPADPQEDDIIDRLRQRFGHVSAERAVSGPGLENLYQAIVERDGLALPRKSAADITQIALTRSTHGTPDGEDRPAVEALELFCAFLGTFAGNAALTFGARGGVFIAGGIAPRMVDFLMRSKFRERFEAKGRFRPYLEKIPTRVITHPAAAFLGLATLIEQTASAGAR
jgi:glucokinase